MLNIKVNPQRRSLKGILLLFVEPYVAGSRESEKYFNPGLTKVIVTVNGSPNMLYNNCIEGKDMWEEASRFVVTVNSTDGVQLELERNASGSGNVNCHVFVISDSQMSILGQQLESVEY